jgi:DNA-binding NarL/FixJ family response regulator
MNTTNVRVLIADDISQVRQGLRTMLELATKSSDPKIEVVGAAQNGKEATELAQALHPDVVLMDLEMPVVDGYEATRQIKANHPTTRIIILSIHISQEEQQAAFVAGADSFIEKSAPLDGLIRTIQNFKKNDNGKELE